MTNLIDRRHFLVLFLF